MHQNGALLPTPALDLTARVCTELERGLLGVAVDPAFATNGFIYVFYTFRKFSVCGVNDASAPVNRVSRFTLPSDNRVSAPSELVLVDNIPSPDGGHNPGDLQFGRYDLLYISVGDGRCHYRGDSGLRGPERCRAGSARPPSFPRRHTRRLPTPRGAAARLRTRTPAPARSSS